MPITRRLALYPIMLLLLTAATCPPADPAVVVNYRQTGACNGYVRATGPGGALTETVSAGGNAAYVAFKVISIDNSKRSTPFHFDPTRMTVNGTSPLARVSTTLSLARDLAPLTAVPVNVPAGNNQGNNGTAVAVVHTGAFDGATEANQTSYLLSYESEPGGPSVFMAKANASQTAFPNTQDCAMITF